MCYLNSFFKLNLQVSGITIERKLKCVLFEPFPGNSIYTQGVVTMPGFQSPPTISVTEGGIVVFANQNWTPIPLSECCDMDWEKIQFRNKKIHREEKSFQHGRHHDLTWALAHHPLSYAHILPAAVTAILLTNEAILVFLQNRSKALPVKGNVYLPFPTLSLKVDWLLVLV